MSKGRSKKLSKSVVLQGLKDGRYDLSAIQCNTESEAWNRIKSVIDKRTKKAMGYYYCTHPNCSSQSREIKNVFTKKTSIPTLIRHYHQHRAKEIEGKLEEKEYITAPCIDTSKTLAIFEEIKDKQTNQSVSYYRCTHYVIVKTRGQATKKEICNQLFAAEFYDDIKKHYKNHLMERLQEEFEQDVNNLKSECDELDLKSTSTCNFSKNGHNTNTTKSLPLACGYLVNKHLGNKWIPSQGCNMRYCVRNGGKNCDEKCFNLKDYKFSEKYSLGSLVANACKQDNLSEFVMQALMEKVVDEKIRNCSLRCRIKENMDEYIFMPYIKRIGASRLDKSADISQV